MQLHVSRLNLAAGRQRRRGTSRSILWGMGLLPSRPGSKRSTNKAPSCVKNFTRASTLQREHWMSKKDIWTRWGKLPRHFGLSPLLYQRLEYQRSTTVIVSINRRMTGYLAICIYLVLSIRLASLFVINHMHVHVGPSYINLSLFYFVNC